jgi:hypothetical protein
MQRLKLYPIIIKEIIDLEESLVNAPRIQITDQPTSVFALFAFLLAAPTLRINLNEHPILFLTNCKHGFHWLHQMHKTLDPQTFIFLNIAKSCLAAFNQSEELAVCVHVVRWS